MNCDAHRSTTPLRGAKLYRLLVRGIAILTVHAGLCLCPALASTVVVPDEISTVQSAIDSGADTVLIREGNYPERLVVDHAVALQGIGSGKRPRLDGMDSNNAYFPLFSQRVLSVSQIDFSGSVIHTTVAVHPRDLLFRFSDCSLGAGIQLLIQDVEDIGFLDIGNSHLSGQSAGTVSSFAMDADTVDGGVSWRVMSRGGSALISRCWFRGGNVAMELTGEPDGTVGQNRIEGYETGILASDAYLAIQGNSISRCGTGMRLSGDDLYVSHNDIRNCGTGVYASCDVLRLLENTIVGCTGHGVEAYPWGVFLAERNVVGVCRGAGMRVGDPWSYYGGLLRSNTIFNNSGSAMELSWAPAVPSERRISVENNIGFGNGGWGLRVAGSQIQHGCNDWFGSRLGAVSGVAPDTTDLNVDPLFCDEEGGDVSLDSKSPLLAVPGCGPVGALGAGCGETPTLLQMLAVEPRGRGAVVRWRFGSVDPARTWLERGRAEAGPWDRVTGEPEVEGEAYSQVDGDVSPGLTYWYRVGWLEAERQEAGYSSPVSFTLERRLSLSRVFPNPSPGPVTIEWTLGASADMEFRVYDLVGRVVATAASGRFEAGRQSVRWDGRRSGGQAAPAGWYVVRVRGGTIDSAHRLLLLR